MPDSTSLVLPCHLLNILPCQRTRLSAFQGRLRCCCGQGRRGRRPAIPHCCWHAGKPGRRGRVVGARQACLPAGNPQASPATWAPCAAPLWGTACLGRGMGGGAAACAWERARPVGTAGTARHGGAPLPAEQGKRAGTVALSQGAVPQHQQFISYSLSSRPRAEAQPCGAMPFQRHLLCCTVLVTYT
jgi:hypothetical protein